MTAAPPAGTGEAAEAVSQPESSVKTEVKPEPSVNTEVKPEPVGDTDGQPESTGNTDTYVTSLSKEEEDRLLKASPEPHI